MHLNQFLLFYFIFELNIGKCAFRHVISYQLRMSDDQNFENVSLFSMQESLNYIISKLFF